MKEEQMIRLVKGFVLTNEPVVLHFKDNTNVFGTFEPQLYENNHWSFLQNNFSSRYMETNDHKIIIDGNLISKIVLNKDAIEIMVELKNEQNSSSKQLVRLCRAYDTNMFFYNGKIQDFQINIPVNLSYNTENPTENEFDLPTNVLTPKSVFIDAISEKLDGFNR